MRGVERGTAASVFTNWKRVPAYTRWPPTIGNRTVDVQVERHHDG
jgi:hypothetical protein